MDALVIWRQFQEEVEREELIDMLVERVASNLKMDAGKTKNERERDKHRRYTRANLLTDKDLEGMTDPTKQDRRRLAIGLVEEDDDGESGCVGNSKHDHDTGRFSSKKPRGSWSNSSKFCKGKGQYTRSAGSSESGRDAEPCGRKSRKRGGTRRKCADPGAKVDRSKNEGLIDHPDGEKKVRKIQDGGTALATIEKIIRRVVRDELVRMRVQMSKQKKGCNFGAFLRQQDQLARAKSGELTGKKNGKG